MAVVLHHSKSTGTDKVVLLGIANHDGDGGAWPSIETLCKYANRSERAVQYAISRLVELGELVVVDQDGGTHQTDPRYRPNLYVLTVRCPPDCDGTVQHRTTPGVQSVAPLDDSGVQSSAVRGATDRGSGVQPVAPEPSIQPSLEPPVSFADFWELYPRKIGKGAAEKSWKVAIKREDPVVILARLHERVEWWRRARTEKQFIPHPATWLNQKRWDDELDPIRRSAASQTGAAEERAVRMRDEAEQAIDEGRPDVAWQIICERAAVLGDERFGMIASMLDERDNLTISRLVDCELGDVVKVREMRRRLHDRHDRPGLVS